MLRSTLLVAVAAALFLAPGAFARCVEGQNGCETCDPKTGRCVECQHYGYSEDPLIFYESYGLSKKGTCVKCQPQGKSPDLCYTCDADQPKRCTECNDFEMSWPVYLKRDFTCAYCPEGCNACQKFTGLCTGCYDGWFFRKVGNSKAGKCVRCAHRNCADCTRNQKQCRRCEAGSMFVKGKCTLCSRVIPHCSFCEKGRCTSCDSGYGVENGRCVKCKVKGCELCWNDASRCED